MGELLLELLFLVAEVIFEARGVRHLEEANLFFPEEMPDLIAEEAEMLWNLRR
jgi:haloalkane dehalogenase